MDLTTVSEPKQRRDHAAGDYLIVCVPILVVIYSIADMKINKVEHCLIRTVTSSNAWYHCTRSTYNTFYRSGDRGCHLVFNSVWHDTTHYASDGPALYVIGTTYDKYRATTDVY